MKAIAFLYFTGADGKTSQNANVFGLVAKLELEIKKANTGTLSINSKTTVSGNKMGRFDRGNAFRGYHTNPDGSTSSNVDYVIGIYKGLPVVTNSLAPHYIKNYWHALPEEDKNLARKIIFSDGTIGTDYIK